MPGLSQQIVIANLSVKLICVVNILSSTVLAGMPDMGARLEWTTVKDVMYNFKQCTVMDKMIAAMFQQVIQLNFCFAVILLSGHS